jgi:MSHA pilin protein MshD
MPHPSRSNPRPASSTERQRGLSLVETVLFIAVLGIALAGVLAAYQRAVRGSADPLVRKQAGAVAESLLTEVLMQPFTWCDPQDPANDADSLPASAAACGVPQDALGPAPAGESRGSASDPFDNVADYHGLAMGPGITALDGSVLPELAGYAASVSVTHSGALFGLADGAVLRVDVMVSGRGESVTLTGYRFRHSPNATG